MNQLYFCFIQCIKYLKMNRSIIFIVQITVLSQISFSAPDDFPVQDDTIYIPNISSVPVFDGITNDECWTFADWQTIDQVWIPYGESVSPADYTGILFTLQSKLMMM
jgi:hypothetical protein